MCRRRKWPWGVHTKTEHGHKGTAATTITLITKMILSALEGYDKNTEGFTVPQSAGSVREVHCTGAEVDGKVQ